jgi:hypothetical protein
LEITEGSCELACKPDSDVAKDAICFSFDYRIAADAEPELGCTAEVCELLDWVPLAGDATAGCDSV